MAEVSKELRSWLFGSSAKQQAWLMAAFVFTCWACAIVGIVSDVIDKKLGLESTNWFIGSASFLIAAVWHWFRAYHAAKEG
jgi:hypothetical protein